MNKTKIEWCDKTWNPVTGCLHGCEYCYAKRMTQRFSTQSAKPTGDIHAISKRPNTIYPFGFDPTFHRYRLDEPQETKKSSTIFVCSMADLFGEWVPDEWIEEVFKACAAAPQHRYLFLTKNPDRVYWEDENGNDSVWKSAFDDVSVDESVENLCMMFGASVTSDNDSNIEETYSNLNIDWVSIEPMLGEISEDFFSYAPRNPNAVDEIARWKWVVIGAETGNRKGKVTPKREWIENIAQVCKEYGIPVFMKESLRDIWQKPLIQQFPWESVQQSEQAHDR